MRFPTGPQPPLRETEFVCLLAGIQALQALAIDVMLPALGEISRDLGVTDPNHRQLTIGVFLICSGVGSLFPGAIADRFGRRPVVMVCLAIYVALSLASALVWDFNALLALRGLMGLFVSGLLVMPMAIIRDRFIGDRMARVQSLVAMTFMVVPMLAPTVGQSVMLVANWRWIFAVMAILASALLIWVWLRLPETLHPDYRQTIKPGVIIGNMAEVLRCRASIGYLLGAAMMQGVMFGWLNSSQQLLVEHFGAGTMFPLIFGGIALTMSGMNFVNASIVERFGARRVSQTAVIVYILIAAVHLLSLLRGEGLWTFVPFIAASMCLVTFIGSNFASISLQPFSRTAGAASSITAFTRLLIGALLGTVIGQVYDGTAIPLFIAMTIGGSLTLALVFYSERGVLFRRLNPPPLKAEAG